MDLLQLVRTLVSPNNPQNQTVACQKVMNHCGKIFEGNSSEIIQF